MKNKFLVFSITFLITAATAFGQDTSRLIINHLNNGDTLTPVDAAKNSRIINGSSDKSHSEVNVNRGTSMPNTTSGTLNSSVNPNTQFVIPFNKKNKKPVPATTSNTGVVNENTNGSSVPSTQPADAHK